MSLRVGVLASGRGSNLQALLDKQIAGELAAEIVTVISDQKKAFALERAKQNGVAAYYIDPHDFADKQAFEQKILQILQHHDAELIVLAGYMRLVGQVLISAYPQRIMNIHPALLPSFKGLHAQKQALDYGVKVAGCTVHFVDEGMDSGPIIIQRSVPVMDNDDEDSLAARILEQEHIIYAEAVNAYARGELEISGRRVIRRDQSLKTE